MAQRERKTTAVAPLGVVPTPPKPPVRTTIPTPTNLRSKTTERMKADSDRSVFGLLSLPASAVGGHAA